MYSRLLLFKIKVIKFCNTIDNCKIILALGLKFWACCYLFFFLRLVARLHFSAFCNKPVCILHAFLGLHLAILLFLIWAFIAVYCSARTAEVQICVRVFQNKFANSSVSSLWSVLWSEQLVFFKTEVVTKISGKMLSVKANTFHFKVIPNKQKSDFFGEGTKLFCMFKFFLLVSLCILLFSRYS